jgi:hypothetical protein
VVVVESQRVGFLPAPARVPAAHFCTRLAVKMSWL